MAKRFVLCFILFSSCASTPKDDVVRAETQLQHALDAGDVQTLCQLWDDRLLFTFPNGSMLGKEERLKAISASPVAQGGLASTVDDLRVEVYRDMATTSVLSTWPGAGRYRATHVWVKQRGGWRLVAAHVSALR